MNNSAFLKNSQKSSRPKQPLFLPKLFSTLKDYSWKIFWGDLSSGIIVGIVALPLAIAFAIASGVTPDRGLTTAIIAGFLISALGGSRVQIGGPTGAFVVIVYHIVEKYGINGLLISTLMAGIMLIALGLLRLGTMIRFVPYPLTVGFTSGIAVVIFSSQVKDFFGLQTGTLPADFIEKWATYLKHFHTVDIPTSLLSILALLIIIFWPRINRKIPGSIIAIIILTALAQLFHLPVETIESRFGALPTGFPDLVWPQFTLSELKELMSPAFTIALLGAIESLLSATVADGMIEGRHRSNTELIAQGIANLITPLFGGIPATGAIARTATNVKNGAKTPVAGIIHALTLLLILLVLGPLARLIPLCVFASILMVVSYHMSEWHAFRALLKSPRMDVAVLLVTFLTTVLVDLTLAVEIGSLLSIILFMKRMTDVTTVREVTREMDETLDEDTLRSEKESISKRSIPNEVRVYEAEGALFFGVAELVRDNLDIGENPPKIIILRMRHVLALDATGIRALLDLKRACRNQGTQLVLSGLHAQPLFALTRADLFLEFGKENITANIDEALQRARNILHE